jgi:regulatory protein
MGKSSYVSKDDALKKLQRYCAYQDRCHQEVRRKLLDLGVYGDDLEEIISELISENFLNEERFARSFARGKFRIKGWGKTRIKRELQLRKVSEYCIRKGLSEIDPEAYRSRLREVMTGYAGRIKEKESFNLREKLFQYVYRRGYETPIIRSVMEELKKDQLLP